MATYTATPITTLTNSTVQISGGTNSIQNIYGEMLSKPFTPIQLRLQYNTADTGHIYIKLIKKNYDGKDYSDTLIPDVSEFQPNGRVVKVDFKNSYIKDFQLDGNNYLTFPVLANQTVTMFLDYKQNDLTNFDKPIAEGTFNEPQEQMLRQLKLANYPLPKKKFIETPQGKTLLAILIIAGIYKLTKQLK